MSVTNFKTENNTFRKLMGNGIAYRIPRFQRDYSWDMEQWEDLWSDILSSIRDTEDCAHYMGYLVLQSADDRTFDVIDGQQRLTTASLIILAVLKNIQQLVNDNIEASENSQRIEQIRNTYIGYLDPVTLISHSKLTLNKNNNSFYQNFLVPLGKLPQRKLKSSEHLLRKAFEFFDRMISDYLENIPHNKGKELALLVENISDNLFFTVITVTDELNAYKVFETLNSRGVRLSSTDLLKNYLFSILDRNENTGYELNNLEERWDNIVSHLQSEKFPDFLRVHWNSRHKLTRHSELFKNIRKVVKNAGDVFSLIRDMEEDLDHFISLIEPELSTMSTSDKKNSSLLKLWRVKQPYSLLLAAKRSFSENDFSVLLNAVKVISFRYNIIGSYSPTDLEKVYNSVAQQISGGKITEISQVWTLLQEIYIEDQRFYHDFSESSIKTNDSRLKKIVRYILCELENYVSDTALDFNNDSYNIEHILPQNAPDQWGGFSSYEEESAMVYRLGNMTLLQSGKNRDIGADEYVQKKEILAESSFKITSKVAGDYSEWNATNVSSRQKWMAKQAKSIWRVSQLEKKRILSYA
ncbi:MAG: DUF262 domain-containing protein [Succinivibrio sp.]